MMAFPQHSCQGSPSHTAQVPNECNTTLLWPDHNINHTSLSLFLHTWDGTGSPCLDHSTFSPPAKLTHSWTREKHSSFWQPKQWLKSTHQGHPLPPTPRNTPEVTFENSGASHSWWVLQLPFNHNFPSWELSHLPVTTSLPTVSISLLQLKCLQAPVPTPGY